MALILPFPRHRLAGTKMDPCKCQQRDNPEWTCMICDGGLALCITCGGAEASMPTDCPGYHMEDVVQDSVQMGEVDYDWKLGWVQRSAMEHYRRKG